MYIHFSAISQCHSLSPRAIIYTGIKVTTQRVSLRIYFIAPQKFLLLSRCKISANLHRGQSSIMRIFLAAEAISCGSDLKVRFAQSDKKRQLKEAGHTLPVDSGVLSSKIKTLSSFFAINVDFLLLL